MVCRVCGRLPRKPSEGKAPGVVAFNHAGDRMLYSTGFRKQGQSGRIMESGNSWLFKRPPVEISPALQEDSY